MKNKRNLAQGPSRPTPARLQSNDTNSEALFCHCIPPWCRRSLSTAAVVLRFCLRSKKIVQRLEDRRFGITRANRN